MCDRKEFTFHRAPTPISVVKMPASCYHLSMSLPFPALLVAAIFLSLPRLALSQTPEAKAWAIIVPKIEFRGATLDESVSFFRKKSQELDPARQGLNIVSFASLPEDRKLNLRLTNIPLREALRYTAQLSGLRLSADQHALTLIKGERNGPPAGFRGVTAADTAAQLTIPKLEFREATLPEVLDFFTARSCELDPKKHGVNIVLDVPPEKREARISLSLQNVPLGEAVRYAAQLAGLDVVGEPYALVISQKRKP
jgi:hypothetical protein